MERPADAVRWLLEHAGPILRYRTLAELGGPPAEVTKARKALLACDETRRWLRALDASTHIHGSTSAAAENCIAKLGAFGLT